jgi:hypothetical protein
LIQIVEQKGRTNETYSSPNDHPTRNFLDAFIGHLEDDTPLLDFLNHGFGQDVDFSLLESGFGVIDEGLAERGKNGWKSLHEGDLHPVGELWVPGLEILLQEIMKLATVVVD